MNKQSENPLLGNDPHLKNAFCGLAVRNQHGRISWWPAITVPTEDGTEQSGLDFKLGMCGSMPEDDRYYFPHVFTTVATLCDAGHSCIALFDSRSCVHAIQTAPNRNAYRFGAWAKIMHENREKVDIRELRARFFHHY